jgi:pimeloyl-ACP methyl ester carboxylesterase
MKQIVVFLPGIMGSCLLDVKNEEELWGENIGGSFTTIVNNPGLLKLGPDWIDSKTISAVRILKAVKLFGFTVGRMYERLSSELESLSEREGFIYVEFPYDWRKDVLRTAETFGETLKELSAGDESQVQFTIVAHSMGCLVTALTLMNGHVKLAQVRNVILIAPPFLGSPSAFMALYDTGYLPGFDIFERALALKRDRLSRVSNILQVFQTFQSLYQLLPHEDEDYLFLPGGEKVNPLKHEDVIPKQIRDLAKAAHERLAQFGKFLTEKRISHIVICGISNARRVRLKFHGLPESRHRANLTYPQTTPSTVSATYGMNIVRQKVYTSAQVEEMTEGDGTVPLRSARLGEFWDTPDELNVNQIEGVQHDRICEDPRVIALIVQHLPFQSSGARAAKI